MTYPWNLDLISGGIETRVNREHGGRDLFDLEFRPNQRWD